MKIISSLLLYVKSRKNR